MSEQTTAAETAAAAPAPKPKRPKPKSMILLGEQTQTLFDNAKLAKKWGGPPRFFLRRSPRRWT